jgi:hypothetical protein
MAKGGRDAINAACGVTPQAQNTGMSPSTRSTGSPKSGADRSVMPSSWGIPICTGLVAVISWLLRLGLRVLRGTGAPRSAHRPVGLHQLLLGVAQVSLHLVRGLGDLACLQEVEEGTVAADITFVQHLWIGDNVEDEAQLGAQRAQPVGFQSGERADDVALHDAPKPVQVNEIALVELGYEHSAIAPVDQQAVVGEKPKASRSVFLETPSRATSRSSLSREPGGSSPSVISWRSCSCSSPGP